MDLVGFREYCLSLGEVSEKMPFGKFAKRYDSILAFYVEGHMFCFIDVDDFSWVNLKSTPDGIAALRETYLSVSSPINMSPRHWVGLDFGGDIPEDIVFQKVAEAYRIVREQYRPKKRRG